MHKTILWNYEDLFLLLIEKLKYSKICNHENFFILKGIYSLFSFMRYILVLLFSVTLLASCTETKTGVKTPVKWTASGAQVVMTPSPTYGTGKHELKIFADFQCPACINFSKSLAPVFEKYAQDGYLRITYKQYPLSQHKNAERDALAALCVAEQGIDAYMDYKHALYALEDVKKWATTSDEDRLWAAKDIKSIDWAKLASCLSDEKYAAKLQQDKDDGNAIHIEGTPTILLDDKKIDLGVFRDIDTLKTVMNRMLEVPTTTTWSGLSE